METIERQEFWNRYHFRPTQLEKLEEGETHTDKRHGDFKVITKVRDKASGFNSYLVFEHEGVQTAVDLAPHWERGPVGKITINREGAVSLIGAVMAQAEKDLEKYYAGGEVEFQVEPLIDSKGNVITETKEQNARRRKIHYQRAVRECEDLLGSVFSKYTWVKVMYEKGMSIDDIAKGINDTPQAVCSIIYRLGLNRTDSGQEDAEDDADEDFITDDY